MGYRDDKFSDLIGLTLIGIVGANRYSGSIIFETEDHDFEMFHQQDCCESVSIEEIIGDIGDIIGSPILVAEERSQRATNEEIDDSGTWTFYEIATIKGSVTFRWLGESNGYYSESVDFRKIKDRNNL